MLCSKPRHITRDLIALQEALVFCSHRQPQVNTRAKLSSWELRDCNVNRTFLLFLEREGLDWKQGAQNVVYSHECIPVLLPKKLRAQWILSQ